jgi:hypothetical protein
MMAEPIEIQTNTDWATRKATSLESERWSMNYGRFTNFGELYRAAFAERDPMKKQLFLREVKNTIDRCCEPPQHSVSDIEKRNASGAVGSPVSFRKAA